MINHAQSSTAVQQSINDLRDPTNLYVKLKAFSKNITEMSAELDEKVKRYELIPDQKDEIVAGYVENFIYSVVQILVKADKHRGEQ